MRIVVTGGSGLLGWHFRCRARTRVEAEVVSAHRSDFEQPARLTDLLRGVDVVLHFAGMNRGEEDELERVNRSLAEELVAALEASGARPHLVFSSSTHIDRETPYGRSKRAATAVFNNWANRNGGARFTNLVLPHVFGECGRPFYNSVVSTFCHQIANGETPQIDHDGQLQLLHAQEVAALCFSVIDSGTVGEIRPEGVPIRVSEMLVKVQEMADTYRGGVIPAVPTPFDLRLFNTLRSYLYPGFYPRTLELLSDDRGFLFEAVRTNRGGQAFLSSTRPGITRGEHFHLEKIERFLVVRGEAVIRLRRLLHDEVREFRVSGKTPVYIDMPTLHTHNITNVGSDDLLTLFWSHEIFNPSAPDTYAEPVHLVEPS